MILKWYQANTGERSMIDVVVISSDLQPYVLDTWVKKGAELSTDHHLVVSWIRCFGRLQDRPGKPKRVVRVSWEHTAEASVSRVFNSHLQKNFSFILGDVGDMECELAMFKASIVEAADRSCGLKVIGANQGSNLRTRLW